MHATGTSSHGGDARWEKPSELLILCKVKVELRGWRTSKNIFLFNHWYYAHLIMNYWENSCDNLKYESHYTEIIIHFSANDHLDLK